MVAIRASRRASFQLRRLVERLGGRPGRVLESPAPVRVERRAQIRTSEIGDSLHGRERLLPDGVGQLVVESAGAWGYGFVNFNPNRLGPAVR